MLRNVSKNDPNYIKCDRILKVLNYLLPVDEALMNEIPPLSILREFIGGNTLYLPPEVLEQKNSSALSGKTIFQADE